MPPAQAENVFRISLRTLLLLPLLAIIFRFITLDSIRYYNPIKSPQVLSNFHIPQVNLITYADRIARPNNQPGFALLVAQNGHIIYTKACGSANIELNVRVQINMRFRLASITKQFASVAVMILVEDGLLSLDQPVVAVLKHYPISDERFHHVTIHNLMTHTSGIPHWREWMVRSAGMDFSHFDDVVRGIMNETLLFDPGTDYSYSSAAYQVLGAVIEEVAGMSFERFLEMRIFSKAGMKDTCVDDPARIIPGRVQGYTYMNGRLENANHIINASRRHAGGGLMSTVQDLLRWDKALHTHKVLLNDTSLKQLHSPFKFQNGTETECSSGFFHSTINDVQVLSHGGMHYGFTGAVMSARVPDVYVAVLANTDNEDEVAVDEIVGQVMQYALSVVSEDDES